MSIKKNTEIEEPKVVAKQDMPEMDLRSKIRNANDRKEEEVFVPEWDTTILLRSLTAGDLVELQQSAEVRMVQGQPRASVKRWGAIDIIIKATCNPKTGSRIFGPEDADWLQDKHIGVVMRLEGIIDKLSSTRPDDLQEANRDFQVTRG